MSTAPLSGVRVVDTTDDSANFAGRLLADLGAEVILVEPPGGSPARALPPIVGGASLSFSLRNANKRSIVLDTATAEGQQQLLDLLGGADVWIDTGASLDVEAVSTARPDLVVVSVQPFGEPGPYSGYQASDPVLFALSGMLSLSRIAGRPPLLPPGRIAYDVGGVMAAYLALVGLWNRMDTGDGQHFQLSLHEAMVQAADAVLPVAEQLGPRGPISYPTYRCTDGFVRIVLLLPRHTEAMLAWLDEGREGGPLDRTDAAEVAAEYARFFAARDVASTVDEAQRRGIPLAPVLSLQAVLDAEPLREGRVFVDGEVLANRRAALPAGLFQVGEENVGFRHRAPDPGEHTDEVLASRDTAAGVAAAAAPVEPGPPLKGVRVLDFGVVYAAPETGKLLADFGADVIRVESRSNPDLARLAGGAAGMSAQFVTLNRNKRSFGVDLKSDTGRELVRRLVERSDVLIENMARGVLEKLGLGADELRQLNPGLIIVSSQLFGRAGGWSDWRGFGPSARGAGGLSGLWRYPDDETGFADSTSVFPDHFVGRLGALAALAWLIERRASGHGEAIRIPQAGAVTNHLSEQFVMQSLAPESTSPVTVTSGVYACAGDDQWCVVTIVDDHARRRVAAAIDASPTDDLQEALAAWTSSRTPTEAMEQLQAAGIAAAAVLTPTDVLSDPHLVERGFIRVLMQPGWDPLFVEGDSVRCALVPETPLEPAPVHGEHTREIAVDVLGLSEHEVDDLVSSGVLEVPPP